MNYSEFSRRTFIKFMGLSSMAFSLPGFTVFDDKKISAKIGIQLYTVRKEIEKDFDSTMKKISDMGFLGIESYDLPPNITLNEAAKKLKELNLEVFSMHCSLPVGKEKEKILRMADAYNSNRAVYHGWPEDEKYKSEDALKQTVELYNEAAHFLESNGIRFGLHNHWYEFHETNGIIPFYYLLEHLNTNIFFEIDTYWTKTAGLNPSKVISDFGERAPLLHIKDGPAPKGKPVHVQVPLGEGTLDFPSIAEAGKDTVEWMIVEFDECETDIIEAVQKSFNYLTQNKFAKGKI